MRGARPELRVVENEGSDQEHSSCAPNDNPEKSATMAHLTAPPASLPADLAAEWQRIVADLQARRLWQDSMASLVTAYVLAQATVLRLELQIATEGASVVGAGGALKPHPATGLLRSSRDTIARLGGELGLTPTSRARKSLRPAADGQTDMFGDEFDL